MKKNGYMDEWIRVPSLHSGDKLYHYTTAEGARGIVSERKFLATKSDYLNDKMEFLYALEIMEKLVDTYIVNETLGHNFLHMVKEEIDALAIMTPSCQNACSTGEQENGFYVVAFSKVQNGALLWAEFTDFKGYCLEFDYEKLVNGFTERVFLHGTVIYDEAKQTACLLEALLACIRKLTEDGQEELESFFEEESWISKEQLRELAKDMAVVCSVCAMFFKSPFFAGEEEYRFVFSPVKGADNEVLKPHFRIAEQVFLPYIMVKYDSKGGHVPLESVMVGAKNNSDIAVRGIRYFLQGEGLDIPVLLSDIPLRY